MPPKSDEHGISTDLAMKIGEIIGKLDQLIKSVDESKIEGNRRMDDFENRLGDHDKKLAQRELQLPVFEELQRRVDALETARDVVQGGAKGLSAAGSVLKDYIFPSALAILAFFTAHFVWDRHDDQAIKPVIVNPPAVYQRTIVGPPVSGPPTPGPG